MSMSRLFAGVCAIFSGLFVASVSVSQPLRPAGNADKMPLIEMQLIEIGNGPNVIDIDGRNGLVFQAHRENYNAHSFDIVTFYRQEEGAPTPR